MRQTKLFLSAVGGHVTCCRDFCFVPRGGRLLRLPVLPRTPCPGVGRRIPQWEFSNMASILQIMASGENKQKQTRGARGRRRDPAVRTK